MSKGQNRKNFAMASRVVGRFSGLTRQTSGASETSDPSESAPAGASRPPSSSIQGRRGSNWKVAAQKSVDGPSPAGSQASEVPSQASSKIKSMGGLVRKISPKQPGSVTPATSSKGGNVLKAGSQPTSKKRSGGSAMSFSKLSKMNMSFGPTGSFGTNIKSLQSASMILGKFIKTKSSKKTEDEVLAGFGAEKESSSDEELKITKPMLEKQISKEEAHTVRKKGLLGKIGRAASVAKSKMKSGSSIDEPESGGGGDQGGVSLTMLSKMATFQKQTRLLIAAAYVGGQLAPWDALTKTWGTGIPTSIRFLGRSSRVSTKIKFK